MPILSIDESAIAAYLNRDGDYFELDGRSAELTGIAARDPLPGLQAGSRTNATTPAAVNANTTRRTVKHSWTAGKEQTLTISASTLGHLYGGAGSETLVEVKERGAAVSAFRYGNSAAAVKSAGVLAVKAGSEVGNITGFQQLTLADSTAANLAGGEVKAAGKGLFRVDRLFAGDDEDLLNLKLDEALDTAEILALLSTHTVSLSVKSAGELTAGNSSANRAAGFERLSLTRQSKLSYAVGGTGSLSLKLPVKLSGLSSIQAPLSFNLSLRAAGRAELTDSTVGVLAGYRELVATDSAVTVAVGGQFSARLSLPLRGSVNLFELVDGSGFALQESSAAANGNVSLRAGGDAAFAGGSATVVAGYLTAGFDREAQAEAVVGGNLAANFKLNLQLGRLSHDALSVEGVLAAVDAFDGRVQVAFTATGSLSAENNSAVTVAAGFARLSVDAAALTVAVGGNFSLKASLDYQAGQQLAAGIDFQVRSTGDAKVTAKSEITALVGYKELQLADSRVLAAVGGNLKLSAGISVDNFDLGRFLEPDALTDLAGLLGLIDLNSIQLADRPLTLSLTAAGSAAVSGDDLFDFEETLVQYAYGKAQTMLLGYAAKISSNATFQGYINDLIVEPVLKALLPYVRDAVFGGLGTTDDDDDEGGGNEGGGVSNPIDDALAKIDGKSAINFALKLLKLKTIDEYAEDIKNALLDELELSAEEVVAKILDQFPVKVLAGYKDVVVTGTAPMVLWGGKAALSFTALPAADGAANLTLSQTADGTLRLQPNETSGTGSTSAVALGYKELRLENSTAYVVIGGNLKLSANLNYTVPEIAEESETADLLWAMLSGISFAAGESSASLTATGQAVMAGSVNWLSIGYKEIRYEDTGFLLALGGNLKFTLTVPADPAETSKALSLSLSSTGKAVLSGAEADGRLFEILQLLEVVDEPVVPMNLLIGYQEIEVAASKLTAAVGGKYNLSFDLRGTLFASDGETPLAVYAIEDQPLSYQATGKAAVTADSRVKFITGYQNLTVNDSRLTIATGGKLTLTKTGKLTFNATGKLTAEGATLDTVLGYAKAELKNTRLRENLLGGNLSGSGAVDPDAALDYALIHDLLNSMAIQGAWKSAGTLTVSAGSEITGSIAGYATVTVSDSTVGSPVIGGNFVLTQANVGLRQLNGMFSHTAAGKFTATASAVASLAGFKTVSLTGGTLTGGIAITLDGAANAGLTQSGGSITLNGVVFTGDAVAIDGYSSLTAIDATGSLHTLKLNDGNNKVTVKAGCLTVRHADFGAGNDTLEIAAGAAFFAVESLSGLEKITGKGTIFVAGAEVLDGIQINRNQTNVVVFDAAAMLTGDRDDAPANWAADDALTGFLNDGNPEDYLAFTAAAGQSLKLDALANCTAKLYFGGAAADSFENLAAGTYLLKISLDPGSAYAAYACSLLG